MRVVLAGILTIVTFAFVQGQSFQNDTTFVKAAARYSIDLYTHALRNHSGLYNGRDYVEPVRTGDPHPFFLSDDWVEGNVEYDGRKYVNVPLMYDILSDRLVTELHFNGTPIILVNEKLTHFSMADHSFERIVNETVNNSLPKTGFYDVLYSGTTKVIVRHQKMLQEKIESGEINIDFIARNHYFLFKDGSYFPVRSKKSVLKILVDQKKALKQYAKGRMRIKRDQGASLARLAKFYDTLKQGNQ